MTSADRLKLSSVPMVLPSWSGSMLSVMVEVRSGSSCHSAKQTAILIYSLAERVIWSYWIWLWPWTVAGSKQGQLPTSGEERYTSIWPGTTWWRDIFFPNSIKFYQISCKCVHFLFKYIFKSAQVLLSPKLLKYS